MLTKNFFTEISCDLPPKKKILKHTCSIEKERRWCKKKLNDKECLKCQPVFFGVASRMPLLALYCSAVIATVGVLFFRLFNASFSDLVVVIMMMIINLVVEVVIFRCASISRIYSGQPVSRNFAKVTMQP